MRINIGCGQTPTKGWKNLDNSIHVRLSKVPGLPALLRSRWVPRGMRERFIPIERHGEIELGSAVDGLPFPDGSVEVVYSSHMLEHLDRAEASRFLAEALRVLRPGGIIRIGVPDLRSQVERYVAGGDADAFVERTHMCVPRPRSFTSRLERLLVGSRHHLWMYDGESLRALLRRAGFAAADVAPAGETRIPDHEPLDLRERAADSVFVEAERPGAASARRRHDRGRREAVRDGLPAVELPRVRGGHPVAGGHGL
jgi:SAM-dependent methyltransferase